MRKRFGTHLFFRFVHVIFAELADETMAMVVVINTSLKRWVDGWVMKVMTELKQNLG